MYGDGFWLSILADAALKGSVILAAAGIVNLALRKAPAAARHLVWTAAACSLLALPVLSSFTPSWDLPVSTVTVPADGPLFQVHAVALTDLPRLALGQAVAARPASPARKNQHHAASGLPGGWVLPVWLAGAALSLVPFALGMIAVRWRRRGATPVSEEAWEGLLPELRRVLAIRRRVPVLLSERTRMPMSVGLLRPAVVLPAQAREWPQERRRMVLLHELAHVQRRDCLTQVLARLACSLYWFHPLVWLVSRQVIRERERACDDLVLKGGARASDYAGELLDVARSQAAPRLAWGGLAMARRAQLEGRLLAILDDRVRRGAISRAGVLSAALVSALAVVPIAAIRPVQAQVAADRTGLAKQGDAAASEGRMDEAIEAYRKAAETQKSAFGPDSIEYAAAELRLARYLRAHGDFRSAEAPFSAALPVYERVYGPDSADIADVYEYMGNLALQSAASGKAGEYYNRALSLYARLTGQASGDVARVTALLGQFEAVRGNAREAERLFERALALNPDSLSGARALALELYAQSLRKGERTADAEKMEGEARAIRSGIVERSFGPAKAGVAPLKVGGGVVAPRLVQKVEPQYSEPAWTARHQATAIYAVVIGADGLIQAASLKRAAGLCLDEKGAEALHHWKFEPATNEGRPVSVQATIEVNFRLL